MSDLEARLADLGNALDVGDSAVAAGVVMARLDGSVAPRGGRRGWLLKVAVVVVVVAGALVAVPRSREALADWFGLRGVRIERRDERGGGTPAPFALPGPGQSRMVTVDGKQILVSSIAGVLDDGLVRKIVGPGTGVQQVMVGGAPGLWIDGEPHDVLYRLPDGDVTVTRTAGNTLLWQTGEVLRRVEGFDDLASAVAFAALGT